MEIAALLLQIWRSHKGKIVGGLLGLIFAICVVKYGILVSIFIILSVSIGLYIGKKIDDKVDIKSAVEELFKS